MDRAKEAKLIEGRVISRTRWDLPPKALTDQRPTARDLVEYVSRYQDTKRSDSWE